jgi:Cu/Ag efflux pump CusA
VTYRQPPRADRLAITVPAVLLLIFILLYFNFGSFVPALLISLNVPLAATGGIVALVLRGMPFSISAGVGFIANEREENTVRAGSLVTMRRYRSWRGPKSLINGLQK